MPFARSIIPFDVRRAPSIIAAFSLTIAAFWPIGSRALDYPTRAVHIIIPYSAGGAPDVLMRVVAQRLSEHWGEPVVIENRAGGNTMTGTVAAAKSEPDGYTLFFTADQTFILNPLLYPTLPYAEESLEPIILIATSPHLFAVGKNVEAHNVKEFIAFAKAKPRMLLYGSTGPGSIQRLAAEYFSRIAGVELVHVTYRGAPETVTALIAGDISMTINGMAVILPQLPGGAIRALAISTPQRSPLAPGIPTMQQAGVPGYVSQGAFGLFAPAGVPREIREKIERDIASAVNDAAMKQLLEERSFVVSGLGPDAFRAFIADEKRKWKRTDANIKGD
jgi:tripartite-type tricarboxylate transporter receptor subunit TctC